MRRKWCVAWDASPFLIRIESRHFTRRGADLRLAWLRRSVIAAGFAASCFVTTVVEAQRLDDMVRAMTNLEAT